MSYFYIFLLAGSAFVFLILQFDKQQRKRVDTLLKSTNDVQPLLMMQRMGQKLSEINTVLTGSGPNAAVPANVKREIEVQLRQVTYDYNNGHISLQAYNNKLSDLLKQAGAR